LCHSEITFVLTSGGHNAGIISEPGHPNRSYQIGTRLAHSPWIEPDKWIANTPHCDGSWWPAWHDWLATRSTLPRATRKLPDTASLGKAPGTYVMERYAD
jgi:polyhydroxyalkanoate synthase